MGRQRPGTVSTKLERIATLAKEAPDMAFTSLSHHIDIEFLREAFRRTRKDGASGVDGLTATEYEGNLEENLQSLLDRFKSGTYFAPPVRRTYIPKGGKSKQLRPIGIPTFEDKVLQRAVSMILEAVYEQDFYDCSYGFRPKRSAHQAIEALWDGLMQMRGGWVLEVDIKSYFDTIDKKHLCDFLNQRIRDGVIRRTIHKWLKAGVFEGGELRHPQSGTPQGGVISPILANLYLHHVLDQWFEEAVRPVMNGRCFLTRFADDFTVVFELWSDARRVRSVLPKRFGKYGLEIHPDKTRLLDFRRPLHRKERKDDRDNWPGSFDLLGFTHYWGRSRRGNWVVKRKTAKDRQRRALCTINEWCRRNRHQLLPWQHEQLWMKMRGHYAYYGITGNSRSIAAFHYHVKRTWRKWLSRRSHKAYMNWERFTLLLQHYPLPPPKIVHSAYAP